MRQNNIKKINKFIQNETLKLFPVITYKIKYKFKFEEDNYKNDNITLKKIFCEKYRNNELIIGEFYKHITLID